MTERLKIMTLTRCPNRQTREPRSIEFDLADPRIESQHAMQLRLSWEIWGVKNKSTA
jgi:hypothetical protein